MEIIINFRALFTLQLAVLIVTLFLMLFQKRAVIVNSLYITVVSIVSFVTSSILLYTFGIIVDELNMGGDSFSFLLYICIVVLILINLVVFAIKGNKVRR